MRLISIKFKNNTTYIFNYYFLLYSLSVLVTIMVLKELSL